MQRLDLAAHADAQLGVEIGQGLIEQEDLGIAHDGPAHGDALALAARKCRRACAARYSVRFRTAAAALHALVDQLLVGSAHAQRKRHVFRHRHMRIERIALEHHGDVARLGRQVGDVAPVDGDGPGGHCLQPGEQAQQGRFAATRRPDQDQEFAVGDGKIDVVQHLDGAEGPSPDRVISIAATLVCLPTLNSSGPIFWADFRLRADDRHKPQTGGSTLSSRR